MANQHLRAVTIHDVARVAKVSSATVSRVVNGKSTVAPELARRVLDAVEVTGYVPNITGRALRRQVSDTWAAIVSNVQNPFFTKVVAAFEDAAMGLGHSVMLCNTNEQLDRENQYIDAVIRRRMSGAVIAVASSSRTDLSPLERAGIPVVLIDRRVRGYEGDSVLVDNVQVGRLAAEHLAAQGYRRFACVGGPPHVTSIEDRVLGFRSALAEHGFSLSDEQVRRTDLRTDNGAMAMRSLLGMDPRPDAVYATHGLTTSGVYRAIQDAGLHMPNDIGLVGTDEEDWMTIVRPPVTIIQQPVQSIGMIAAQQLSARSVGLDAAPQHIVLPPVLVERDSSRGFARRRGIGGSPDEARPEDEGAASADVG